MVDFTAATSIDSNVTVEVIVAGDRRSRSPRAPVRGAPQRVGAHGLRGAVPGPMKTPHAVENVLLVIDRDNGRRNRFHDGLLFQLIRHVVHAVIQSTGHSIGASASRADQRIRGWIRS